MEYGEPIHYKELTKVLVECGAWEPYGDKPDQIVYSAMHQDIRRRGEWSAFRLITPGVFCTSEAKGVELVARAVPPEAERAPRPPRKRLGETEKEHAKRVEAMSADACCGNCANLEYAGVEEYRRQTGLCNGWPASGRTCARPADEPCPSWRRLGAADAAAIDKRREDLTLLLVERGFVDVPRRIYDRLAEQAARKKGRTANAG